MILAFILLYSVTYRLTGQNYDVSQIPDSLKENAHAVIREFITEFELKSANSGIQRIKKAITILDKNGENNSYLIVSYDKYSSVNIKQIIIYDKAGTKIKTVKQSEIEDYPAYSSFELYSEERLKYYKPVVAQYPYTVEYVYETESTNLISYGCWRPFNKYNVSVQHASITILHPDKLIVNRREINVFMEPQVSRKNLIAETCTVNNLKAIEEEPFDISISERIPSIYLMPDVLIFNKFEGKATNWNEYGKWIYNLYSGRDKLSDTEKLKIDAMLINIPDTLLRIKTLYKYMQERTRYVAVTLGIGGFQPFDAMTVFETGYGDCKALSNYMFSLLKSIGVKSFPALVAAGTYKVPIFTDFPNFNQFDHVILSVPLKNDTIWLECTNQKIPFGFLGDFTDDRDVLLITENGGIFAHTTRYNQDHNLRVCKSEFKIEQDGGATCTASTVYHGLQYDNLTTIINSNYDEQKKWLYSTSPLPSLQIKDFKIDENTVAYPFAKISITAQSKNYCTFSGQYMILSLNMLHAQRPIKKMLKQRFSDILISRSSVDFDTLVYILPDNYKFESLPQGNKINSVFGNYSSSISGNDKEIIYTRKFEIKEGRYKPSEYNQLYDFILNVSKADNTKVILIKKT